MRVATVLNAIFSIDPTYELTPELSSESIVAAINLIGVCNEHTKIMAGRRSTSPDPVSRKFVYMYSSSQPTHTHIIILIILKKPP